MKIIASVKQCILGGNHLLNEPQVKLTGRMGLFSGDDHTASKAVGNRPMPIYIMPDTEKNGGSKHAKTEQKREAFSGRGSQSLAYLRVTHQGFVSWWTDPLKSICQVLFF